MMTAAISATSAAGCAPPLKANAGAAGATQNMAGVPDPSQRHHGVKGDAGSAAPSTAGKSH